jgi:hypothetical protein
LRRPLGIFVGNHKPDLSIHRLEFKLYKPNAE